jgi:hypothetical protein
LFVEVGTRKNMNHHITWMRGRASKVYKRTYLESVGAISPFKKKDILVVIRELLGEELENLWPFELK